MKLIIAGTRTFSNQDLMAAQLANYDYVSMVVSGGAAGADRLGELWAVNWGLPIKRFIPNWRKFGKKAGMIRNREMALFADKAVVFWDGKSRGTKNMIENMRKLGKPCQVVLYKRIVIYEITKVKKRSKVKKLRGGTER